jgi:hypothetical protein
VCLFGHVVEVLRQFRAMSAEPIRIKNKYCLQGVKVGVGVYCGSLICLQVICSPAEAPAEVARVIARLSQKVMKRGSQTPQVVARAHICCLDKFLAALAAGSCGVVVVARG